MMIKVLLLALFSYLLGAVPTGYLIARKAMGIDIRQHGSGNPGAANVYRTVGKWAGITTFLIDGLKGFIPVSLALHVFPGEYWQAILCGTIAILGHMWTIYLKFRGGKGVATSAGVFAALLPIPTALAFASFVICVALWGRISIGSIMACLVLPITSFFIGNHSMSVNVMATAIGLLVIYKHVPNIKRLLAKKELAFEDGSKKRKNEHK
ncbi:MAG: glycerol-3-phosphate 1-O-acyltransferase PlsY [Elusimicrobiaceae bacterium]|nr:glycerol-3-phosphate 1-O-acyltransferase PlsY [Elusimicrobiaceae bacterium]